MKSKNNSLSLGFCILIHNLAKQGKVRARKVRLKHSSARLRGAQSIICQFVSITTGSAEDAVDPPARCVMIVAGSQVVRGIVEMEATVFGPTDCYLIQSIQAQSEQQGM